MRMPANHSEEEEVGSICNLLEVPIERKKASIEPSWISRQAQAVYRLSLLVSANTLENGREIFAFKSEITL